MRKNYDEKNGTYKEDSLKLADKWILNKLNKLILEVTNNIEKYDLGVALDKIYNFMWNEFCDWYIEMAKVRLYGENLEEYFIRDIVLANVPHRTSRYFYWNRYNFNLDTHFYSHRSMLATMGKPSRRYGLLMESEIIMNKDIKMFNTHKGLEKDFDLIFTHRFV